MKLKALVLVPLAVSALALTACSSDDGGDALDTTSCAPVPQGFSGQPTWTVDGTSGKATFAVTDDAKNAAPKIDLSTPFKVDQTQVKTLKQGSGAEVTDASTVTVCYEGVNGTTGKTFDSAYDRGAPEQFPASGVVPGFRKALVGQKVGSTVGVVIPSADGYPQGSGDGSINPGDTIVFGLKILGIEG
ncbi:FKBP-type peptidyl-prolyl cis-trans isomerase [Gordonia neofelifaecis]|uniref:Peptidyl-prolyl cis-trans isomerase n=1 Tax=Gordonia neofelifaecis NRRL B-59395 TaxID=644548 RepID=F1YHE6_9ACTN|nr:FKBP-type peptidyl-prolyl cis-trans isomerase [Gordonia neofelifaecis]EGD55784.1 peptidylprolyl isomerase, FKBP-type [Gordonia neofelifaecis NRRL B-59395]